VECGERFCSETGEHRKWKCSESPVKTPLLQPVSGVTSRNSSKILCIFYANCLSHAMFRLIICLCNMCFDVLIYSCFNWETLAWMTVVKIHWNRNEL
jgi:hypothetical protein